MHARRSSLTEDANTSHPPEPLAAEPPADDAIPTVEAAGGSAAAASTAAKSSEAPVAGAVIADGARGGACARHSRSGSPPSCAKATCHRR